MFHSPCALILDQATSHDKSVVDQLCKEVQTIYIPKGCTSLVQPLDVSVNRPFKVAIRKQWMKWMDEEEPITTASGRRKRVCLLSV